MAGSRFQSLRPRPFGDDLTMDTSQTRSQRISDHRLRDLVQSVGNADVVADAGIENVNAGLDGLIEAGMLSRVLALRDDTFSNSMIEAWWRTLEHQ